MTTIHYFVMLLTAVCCHAGIIVTHWFIATPARDAIVRDPLILRALGLNESILEGIDNGTLVPPPEIRLTVDGHRVCVNVSKVAILVTAIFLGL
jgi:hypothetical protein